MSFRSHISSPDCPGYIACGGTVTDTNWAKVANSIRALQNYGRVIFEARPQRVNATVWLPLAGWTNGASSIHDSNNLIEIFPGYDQVVVLLELKPYVSGAIYQDFQVFISDGAASYQIASYTSIPGGGTSLLPNVINQKAQVVTLPANIIPQPGFTATGSIMLRLITINPSGNTQSNFGFYGAQIRQTKSC